MNLFLQKQLQEGDLFDGCYRLKKFLGRSEFSEVWLTEDIGFSDNKIALKVYAPGTGLDDDGVKLFRGEFERVFDFNHGNLLRPAHFGVCGRSPYLILPYCERGSVVKLVGNMAEEEAWRFLRDVSSGLAYLHGLKNPVMHQEIKPNNVLIDDYGNFLITDFVISAKARVVLQGNVGGAKPGAIAYMPPERFGEKSAQFLKASDIWALGATLFELLTGDAPFLRFLGGQAQLHGAQIPKVTGKLSPKLIKIVTLCLQKKAWERPTAEQLAKWTAAHFKGDGIPSKKVKKTQPPDVALLDNADKDRHRLVFSEFQRLKSGMGKYIMVAAAAAAVVFGILAFNYAWLQKNPTLEPLEATIAPIAPEERQKEVLKEMPSAGKFTPQREKDAAAYVPENPANKEAEKQLKIEMVYIRGGTFIMGCTPEQGNDCFDDEKPAHQATVSNFFIGKYEVTQVEWKAVMGAEGNPSNFKGDNLPVERVSWNDVREFIGKLNEKTGENYRLPTEAEWEYAARSGSQARRYKYGGRGEIGEVAWYSVNSGDTTHPVGTKRANDLGIYDMSGNVYEWVSDWYGSYDGSSQVNPQGPESGSARVIRGGCWNYTARVARVSFRSYGDPDRRGGNLGFRLARN